MTRTLRTARYTCWFAVLIAALLIALPAQAQQLALADAVKAAQLYKFASFIAWPDSAFTSPTMPIQLCVVGNPAVAAAVGRAATGQTANGRPFAIRDITPGEANSCHMVYFAAVSSATRDVIAQLAGSPVLTVTDEASGASRGVINFVVRDNRVRFEIDNAAAQANRLVVSSRLLVLAVSQ